MLIRLMITALVAMSLFLHDRSEAQTWQNLVTQADSLCLEQVHDSAVALGRSALEQTTRIYGGQDSTTAIVLDRLGYYLAQAWQFAEAESLLNSALAVKERIFGAQDLRCGHTLHEISYLHKLSGNCDKAIEIGLRALAIKKSNPARSDVALTYALLASCYVTRDQYAEADECVEQALHALDKYGTNRDINLVIALMNMSYARALRGDYRQCAEFAGRAVRVAEERYGPDHYAVAIPIVNMASAKKLLGEIDEAEKLIKREINIRRRYPNVNEYRMVLAIGVLGGIYIEQRRFDEAEPLLKEHLERHEGLMGKNWSYNQGLQSYARVFQGTGRFAIAESLFVEALDIWNRLPYPTHQGKTDVPDNFAEFCIETNQYEKAFGLSQRALDTWKPVFAANVPEISEEDARRYALMRQYSLNLLLTSWSRLEAPTRRENEDLISRILSAKGGVTDVIAGRQHTLLNTADPIIKANVDGYRMLLEQLARVNVKNPESRSRRDSLQKVIRRVESELARQSAAFNKHRQMHFISPQEVTQVLPPNTVLIDFMAYNHFRVDTHVKHYVAVVLNGEESFVKDLGPAGNIDQLISRSRQLQLSISNSKSPVSNRDLRRYKSVSRDLYNRIWKPLITHVKKGTTVFIAPDGVLNLISFAGLLDEKGRYLIERHPIHYLSAGRDFVRIQMDSTASGVGLLALGDADYDATTFERLSGGGSFAIENPLDDVATMRNLRSNCDALNEMRVSRLPYTRTEVHAIAGLFRSSNVLEGTTASEENFKKNASGRKAIHIATHGYFISGECNEKSGKKSGDSDDENPLLQSGLLLAGANLHGKDVDSLDAEDGILTALEVSAMDLRGTDLVVLSACETGLGKVEQGEGVYGLRRAFQMAGAKTVVSSLWKIPDKETMQFMKTLYSTKAKTYPELMQQVALKRIREARLRGRPTHPFTWGAFVATGDWRIH